MASKFGKMKMPKEKEDFPGDEADFGSEMGEEEEEDFPAEEGEEKEEKSDASDELSKFSDEELRAELAKRGVSAELGDSEDDMSFPEEM